MENNFANNLKRLRIQSGMTQEELGKKLNKDYSTVGKWENGSRSPIMEDVIKIADLFDVSLHELIDGKYENNINNKVENHDVFKKILKEKGIMDNSGNIDKEKLNEFNKKLEMVDKFSALIGEFNKNNNKED